MVKGGQAMRHFVFIHSISGMECLQVLEKSWQIAGISPVREVALRQQ